MPQFASFVSMRPQPGGGAGFPIGEGLDITRDGKLHLKFSPNGPLYVDQNGEISVRVGTGMRIATGSPPSIVALPAQASAIPSDAVEGAANVLDGLRRLAALILAAQGDIDTAQTDIGALNSLISAIVSSPIKARGSTTLSAGSKTVATVNVTTGDLIFLTYGSVSGTPGALSYGNIVDDTSFDITSSTGALDDSDVAWMVVSP